MKEKHAEVEIDLKKLFFAVLKKLWVILLVGAIVAAAVYTYSACMVTPKYAANIKLFVNNTYGENTQGFSSSQIMAAQSLASTYIEFLGSRDVLEDVRKESGLDYTVGQLRSMIGASSVNQTEVFQVWVTCENPAHAAIIANAVAKVLPNRIAYFLQVEDSSVVVVEHAVENRTPVAPNTRKNTILGMVVGSLLTTIIVIVVSLLDTTIDSEEYLTQKYSDIPLLAVIPDAENPKSGSVSRGYYESYKPRNGGKKKGGSQ